MGNSKKYKVADGASFTAGGHCYGPGEIMDSSLFSDEALKRALKTSERFPHGKLLDAKEAEKKEEQKPADKPADGNKPKEQGK